MSSKGKCSAVSCQLSAKTIKSKARTSSFVFLCLCAFFLMVGNSYAESIHNLTLKEAVSIGLKNSRELTMANLQLEQKEASLREALSQAYPKIIGNINSSCNNLEKTGLPSAKMSEGYSNNLSLSLNQTLWTGGKIIKAIKCSHREIQISLLEIEQAKNETIYKIANSYWNVKKAVELRKACEKRVEYASSIMDIVLARYKEGLVPEVDVMKQEVNLAQIKEELIKALCREKIAGDNLKSWLRIEGEIEILDEPAAVNCQPCEKEAVSVAIASNPEIARRDAEIQSKGLQVLIVKADYLPKVNLIGSYNLRGEDKDGFKKSWDNVSKDSWSTGINIEIPIFNGFYTASKVKEAELSYKGAEENLSSLKDRITLETKEILAQLLEAEERVRVSEKNKELGDEILRIIKIRYELGKATISEVKEAEEIFVRSSTMQIEAMIDYNLCRMNLLRVMGKMGEGFGKE